MTTIGLTMIVKNEASVIARALDSVRAIVDYVHICDTGSSDGTQVVIAQWLDRTGMPGRIIDRPWVDFAYNRNEGIEALRAIPDLDYALTIDADEYLDFDSDFDPTAFKAAAATADAWWITSRDAVYDHRRLQLFALQKPFYYRYILHEVLVAPAGATLNLSEGFHNVYTRDGARGQNPETSQNDVAVLQKGLRETSDIPDIRHYTYYLGQSLAGAKRYAEALEAFLRRTTQGGSSDGTALAYLNAGFCLEKMEADPEAILTMYRKAHEASPDRADPLCAAARVSNLNRLHDQAYRLAKLALGVPPPDFVMFEIASYTWRALDELLVACIGTHRFGEAVEIAERLLSEAKFPESERQRIEQNAAYALAQYELAPVIGPDAAPASQINPSLAPR